MVRIGTPGAKMNLTQDKLRRHRAGHIPRKSQASTMHKHTHSAAHAGCPKQATVNEEESEDETKANRPQSRGIR